MSPVIAGGAWLGEDDRDQPLILQLRLPVSAAELATALYGDHYLSGVDLATDENVWALAAVAIVQDGLNAGQRRAGQLLVAEARGTLANPAWLAPCCHRVAEVTGHATASPAAALRSTATTAQAGAQPPSTTTFHRPHLLQEETTLPGAGHRTEVLAQVRTLTEIAASRYAGN